MFLIPGLVCSLGIAGCMDRPTQQLTGTLHGIPPSDGGAPHRWVLVMGEEGSGYAMPLDVAAVNHSLGPLDGKRVTITAVNKLGGSQQTWIVKDIEPASPF